MNEEGVFVLEPALNVELNVTTCFRLNAGAGYRWISAIDDPGLDSADLSVLYGQVTFSSDRSEREVGG